MAQFSRTDSTPASFLALAEYGMGSISVYPVLFVESLRKLLGDAMKVATDGEVLKWLADIEWNHGIKADGSTLYYVESDVNCIGLPFPETPLRTTYFARVASML